MWRWCGETVPSARIFAPRSDDRLRHFFYRAFLDSRTGEPKPQRGAQSQAGGADDWNGGGAAFANQPARRRNVERRFWRIIFRIQLERRRQAGVVQWALSG